MSRQRLQLRNCRPGDPPLRGRELREAVRSIRLVQIRSGLGCAECQAGPCEIALMPGEWCPHGCGCNGGPEVPA